MSVRVMTAVWDVDLPATEKLVLLALADNANDEGSCWPSACTIARKCGQGERTVRRAIRTLIAKGHLTQTQRSGTSPIYKVHPCRSGTPAAPAPLPDRPQTPAAPAPKPSGTVKPKKDKPSLVRAHELPDDWEPQDFGPDTQSAKVVAGWPPGERQRQLEHFRAHHRKKGSKFKDWQAAWSTWVLNFRSFGNGRQQQQPDSIRGSRPNPALDMWLQAERDGASEYQETRGGGWPALPAGESG